MVHAAPQRLSDKPATGADPSEYAARRSTLRRVLPSGERVSPHLRHPRTTNPCIHFDTVCEPALGSGAFAIEATRQLAEQYLQRRQKELGQTIDPDQYPIELQRAKTYIALHNVYGVDLNATAVELAEITLWLDTMARGLHAPWFGLHLRRGNSLIGCRRAVFRPDQVKDGSWLTNVPRDVSLYSPDDVLPSIGNGIHYFLLPAKGWGASADAKAAKELAPDALKRLKSWRKSVTRKPNHTQCQELAVLAERVEKLWGFAVQRLTIAEAQVRRTVPVWGAAGLPEGGAVTREQIEASLADPAGAFQRLKTVMDAWNALWFWPLTGAAASRTRLVNGQEEAERIDPPSFAEWIETLKDLLGHKPEATSTGGKRWKGGDATLASAAVWNELGAAEKLDLAGAGAASPQQIAERHPWLGVCRSIAEQQGFFHWELMYGHVFHAHGGFDMQVGNPPWVRPRDDDAALLAEFDPWWQLTTKPPVLEVRRRREQLLAHAATRSYFLSASCDLAAQRASVSSPQDYSVLLGLQPDLYRCFMAQTWRHSSARGTIGLIHPETHFTDEAAGLLRQHTYRRLRRHWQFDNELMLFDIDHHVSYGVHVYGSARTPDFIQATSLYHPDTAVRSLDHDGSGPEPGLKDLSGNWDLRPHKSRIIHVTPAALTVWRGVLETPDVPPQRTRMVYTVNSSVLDVLVKASQAQRIGDLDPLFSAGWHETADFNRGRFVKEWGPVSAWDDAILQGPHLHVSLPFFKWPNRTMKHNQDWNGIDLEALAPDELPITSYKPAGSREAYESQYTHWQVGGRVLAARDFYRIAWRRMAANTGERTLISAIIPPGSSHIHLMWDMALPTLGSSKLLTIAASMSSLLLDLLIRVVPKNDIVFPTIRRLPLVNNKRISALLIIRALELNCLTEAYAPLWHDALEEIAAEDSLTSTITDESFYGWTGGIDYPGRRPLCAIENEWTPESRLTRASDRRQALVEIDALAALGLGISADELCSVYRTQFGVLYGYDHERDYFDANGRLVPKSVIDVWKKKGNAISTEERTAVHPQSEADYVYELPFRLLDREADMRRAYKTFEQRLGSAQ